MKTTTWIACLSLATTLAACTGDNEDLQLEVPDASTKETGASAEASTTDDAASDAGDAADAGQVDGDASADAATADATSEADATAADAAIDASVDAAPDASTTNDGAASSDGSPSDSAAFETTIRLSNPVGANLLSSSDVHPACKLSADPTPGHYRVKCEEKSGTAGPCRTLEFVLGGDPIRAPRSGEVFVAVVKAAPGANEAVVQYYESVDCTAGSTNGWVQVLPGGDVTLTRTGDNGATFVLHDVSMGPAPVGSQNHNAIGTFTAAGGGEAYGFFM